jgi:hypothetical protein
MQNVKRKIGLHFKKQYHCAKAKNWNILAARLTSEKRRNIGLRKRTVPAKIGTSGHFNKVDQEWDRYICVAT